MGLQNATWRHNDWTFYAYQTRGDEWSEQGITERAWPSRNFGGSWWLEMAEASSGQHEATWKRNHVGVRRGTLVPLKMIRSFYALATPKSKVTNRRTFSLFSEKKPPENKVCVCKCLCGVVDLWNWMWEWPWIMAMEPTEGHCRGCFTCGVTFPELCRKGRRSWRRLPLGFRRVIILGMMFAAVAVDSLLLYQVPYLFHRSFWFCCGFCFQFKNWRLCLTCGLVPLISSKMVWIWKLSRFRGSSWAPLKQKINSAQQLQLHSLILFSLEFFFVSIFGQNWPYSLYLTN